jgi:cytochrome c peroxidase
VGINGEGDFTDLGRFGQTKLQADRGEFKTPTLRNVALTPPYMHDGSLTTLADVVDFYAGGGNSNPDLDKDMKPLHLSAQERADLVAFLESLNGDMPKNAGPPGKE